jgi:hypothetical protein
MRSLDMKITPDDTTTGDSDMFFFFFPELRDSLKSNKGLFELLRRDAQDKRKRAPEPLDGPEADHPTEDDLADYILGSLGNEDLGRVMKHIAACKGCSRKVLEMRRLDSEMKKGLQKWIKTPPQESEDVSRDEV